MPYLVKEDAAEELWRVSEDIFSYKFATLFYLGQLHGVSGAPSSGLMHDLMDSCGLLLVLT